MTKSRVARLRMNSLLTINAAILVTILAIGLNKIVAMVVFCFTAMNFMVNPLTNFSLVVSGLDLILFLLVILIVPLPQHVLILLVFTNALTVLVGGGEATVLISFESHLPSWPVVSYILVV